MHLYRDSRGFDAQYSATVYLCIGHLISFHSLFFTKSVRAFLAFRTKTVFAIGFAQWQAPI
jgi:hypothetical protein